MRSFMQVRYIYLMIFLSVSLFAQVTEILKIVNPLPADISEENIASFVVQTKSDAIDYIIITSDMNETHKIEVKSERSHYCKSINLKLGENSISVKAYKKDALVKQEKRVVFLTSKVHKEYRYPPKQYTQNYFHSDTNEKICAKCHDMSVNEVEGVAFDDVSKSNCYQCHSSITGKKHSHAPSVNWLCTSCHNGKVGIFNKKDREKTKYSVPDPIGKVCFTCHKKNRDKWSGKRFNHEPAESGRCNKCHNSHSEENEFYLRKSTWELCTGCHKDKIEGMHIATTLGNTVHPTHNKKDPSRPGKDLSCVSCHNPHASSTPSLLQSSSVFALCARCHKK